MSGYYAHTPPLYQPDKWQTMQEHVTNVANLASEFAKPFHADLLAKLAAYLHDIGKYSPEFQSYLKQCHQARLDQGPMPKAGSAEHKAAGAKYALESSQMSAELKVLMSLVVLGHHGGLPKWQDVKSYIRAQSQHRLDNQRTPLENSIELALAQLKDIDKLVAESLQQPFMQYLMSLPNTEEKKLKIEVLTRFLHSCLVDADTLDTEAHFNKDIAEVRDSYPALQDILDNWIERFTENQARLIGKQSLQLTTAEAKQVHEVRQEVYNACLEAAQWEPGVFLLTVPTGGGKTRASLAFALHHSKVHGHQRIIYAIPYTSIIDQTADVFTEILGHEHILEHHSAIDIGEPASSSSQQEEAQAEDSEELRRRLAAQNWDAPLILTTTVQLFESLFANRTTKCRKVHNIARSVLVLDEVQLLPLRMLNPLVDMLNTLVHDYGVTLLLTTATQPDLTKDSRLPFFTGLDEAKIRHIIPDPAPLYNKLRRVTYRVESTPWNWEKLAEEVLRRKRSCLVIVNTRQDALDALRALQEKLATQPDAQQVVLHHLSTLLCGAHRKKVLDEIRAALIAENEAGNREKRTILVATQVVEAGVDLDFPCCFRAKGPLSSAIQAAGRCNREGRHNPEQSEVVLFEPAQGKFPHESVYKQASQVAWNLLTSQNAIDLDDPQAVEAYFDELFKQLRCTLDAKRIQEMRSSLNFPEVADKLRLIENDTVPVLVCYDKDKFAYFRDQLVNRSYLSKKFWRELQPYLVAVNRYRLDELQSQGRLEFLEKKQVGIWHDSYDALCGIGCLQSTIDFDSLIV
jgi:CRISPR-associated endonuclease/helicase Cas3